MQGIQVLYWSLSILFCMAMGFAVLLWCRGWRKEEREQHTSQLRVLAREVARLSSAVDLLEHTSESLRADDEQLARKLDEVRELAESLGGVLSRASLGGVAPRPEPQARDDATSEDASSPDVDTYQRARELLGQGRTAVDVARTLGIGTAEVRMVARMLEQGPPAASGGAQESVESE